MDKSSKIYIAGHTGMVGSAMLRCLQRQGYTNSLLRSHKELNLLRQSDVEAFFQEQRPEYVIIAAARVGGIQANNTYRAQFIYENLTIQNNIINSAYMCGVKKLLFLGSSCIYPKMANQPLREEYLLTGELEPTNEPYAIAKIAGIKMCESYYRQYGCDFLSVMPTNLYGPYDNYNLETSHVLPAIIRKMHLGKCLAEGDWSAIGKDLNRRPIEGINGSAERESMLSVLAKYGIRINGKSAGQSAAARCTVTLWGSGSVRREFMHVDDMAEACVFLLHTLTMADLLTPQTDGCPAAGFVNIGTGTDITIRELAEKVQAIVGFSGRLAWDAAKPDGTPQKLLDILRIRRAGFRPYYTLDEGIRMVYENYCKKIMNYEF